MSTKTKKQIKNFILKTLLPYKQNPDTCAYHIDRCVYLTVNGNKCAVGKWMKVGKWQKSSEFALGLFEKFGFDILKKAARDMNFTTQQWSRIQSYHDLIANSSSPEYKNANVIELEELFNIKLPELMFE